MDTTRQDPVSFADIRERLDSIAKEVRSQDVALDAALDLYDEAVELGIKATELLESADTAASQVPERP